MKSLPKEGHWMQNSKIRFFFKKNPYFKIPFLKPGYSESPVRMTEFY